MKKRVITLLASIALAALFSSCGGGASTATKDAAANASGSSETSAASADSTPAQSEEEAQNAPTVDEQLVYNENGVAVTVKGLKLGEGLFEYGPSLLMLVENSGSGNVLVQARDGVVNGIMVEPMISCEVTAGNKANTEATFFSSSLEKAGIESIAEIQFKLVFIDPDTFDTISESEPIVIQTSAAGSYVQTYDDSGETVVDRDGVKVVVKRLESADSFWGADVYLYIENNTDRNVCVQARDCSVNGFMMNPMFSSSILSGKKAFSEITFLESELESNGIESIEKLDLSFHVFDDETWDTMFDSDIVSVSFG